MKPFQYIKLNITLKELDGEVYPYFLGSFIRGNFGMYLKKTVCPFHLHKSCDECLIYKKCFYAKIFEAQREISDHDWNIPLPFVIDLEESNYPEPVRNSDLIFKILLFGPALNNFEFFILVFSEMGKKGIGKQRIKCKEVIVEDQARKLVYSSQKENILHTPKPLCFEFDAETAVQRLVVSYRSPLRLKRGGKIVQEPDFETLIRSALRRLVFLESLYGTPIELPTREIIEQCAAVKTAVSDVHWVNRFRYSQRRKFRMNLGGLLGRQEFAGDISPFHLDLLRFSSIFHIGKSSTFGHGKIDITAQNA